MLRLYRDPFADQGNCDRRTGLSSSGNQGLRRSPSHGCLIHGHVDRPGERRHQRKDGQHAEENSRTSGTKGPVRQRDEQDDPGPHQRHQSRRSQRSSLPQATTYLLVRDVSQRLMTRPPHGRTGRETRPRAWCSSPAWQMLRRITHRHHAAARNDHDVVAEEADFVEHMAEKRMQAPRSRMRRRTSRSPWTLGMSRPFVAVEQQMRR